jgi:hypothetical protein
LLDPAVGWDWGGYWILVVGMSTAKRRPEKFPLRVIKGGFAPADPSAASRLRDRGYRVGDLLFVEFKKPRNPRFHRLAHAFGRLMAENVDQFEGMDAHRVLKRLQWESGEGCEEMGVMVPGVGHALVRIPLSLSFESMDEGSFKEVFRGLCRHVAEHYWPSLTAEQIEDMAGVMVGED